MDKFKIELAPAALKDLDSLEMGDVKRILKDIKVLEENPFPRGKLIKKIRGKKTSYYRLRTDKFRVFYFIHQTTIAVLRVLNKKEADRFIKKLP